VRYGSGNRWNLAARNFKSSSDEAIHLALILEDDPGKISASCGNLAIASSMAPTKSNR
jgi:hypothetical protein